MAAINYHKDIIDVIRDIVKDMTFPVAISLVTDNGDGTYTLAVDDTYHAQPGFKVTIDGVEYEIVSADDCELVLKGDELITAATFDLYPPFFFHGTPLETNSEIIKENNSFNKTPMIWLMENFTESFSENDPETNIERESELRIFFLTQADFAGWETKNFYDNAIKPMRKLFQNFKKTIEDGGKFEMEDFLYDLINYTKFGVYISGKGFEKSVFADNLSGCECAATWRKLKENECDGCN